MGVFFLFILLFLCNYSSSTEAETKLELIQIIFRHGDRTPIGPYPGDLYNETAWAKFGGYGQLTQQGMQSALKLGQFLRERYSLFLDKIYYRNKVNVRSTDFDRTLMTAQSLLAGLYPPIEYQQWNSSIKWQPIPIHTTEIKNDLLFYYQDCPRYTQLLNQTRSSDEFKDFARKNADLVKLINAGIGNGNVTIWDFSRLSDNLSIQKAYDFKLPNWVNENLERIVNVGKDLYHFYYRTPEMAKITSGPIYSQMKKNFLNKINNSSATNKLYLFSSHDTFLCGILRLLNLTTYLRQPPFAAAIILELRKSLVDERYFIKVFYKNNPSDEAIRLEELRVGGCETLCPIEKFFQLNSEMEVDDIATACRQISMYNTRFGIGLLALTAACSLISAVFITCALLNLKHLIKIHRKRQRLSKEYETVNLILGDMDEDNIDP